MRFQFQKVLINLLFFQEIVSQLIQCEKTYIEPNEIIFIQKKNMLLVQSDEQDLNNFNYSNYKLIEESSKINYSQNEEVISALIVKSNGLSVYNNQFCQLIKSEFYFISCIQKQREDFKDQAKLIIQTDIKNDNLCQEFFFNQNSEFILFCFQDQVLKLHSINFDKKTKLLQQFEIEKNLHSSCKEKYFKLFDNHYLIAFYQCQNWGLYAYYNQIIDLILNEKIIFSNFSQQIQYLENIEVCMRKSEQYRNLLLISELNYYQSIINLQNQISNLNIHNGQQNLKQVLFSESCNQKYFIQYFSSNNKIIIHNQQELEGTYINAFLYLDIIFIQFVNKLQIIYNQQFQQVININASKIYFDSNFIYQLDQSANEIILYNLSISNGFVRPQKKYIFLIFNNPLSLTFRYSCIEVNYIQSYQTVQQLSLDFTYKCEKTSTILCNKKGFNLSNEYQIKKSLNTDLNINIFDKIPFDLIHKKNSIKNQTLIYYFNDSQQCFYLIKADNYILKHACEGLIQLKIQTAQFQIFQHKSSILLWQMEKKFLRFTKFKNTQSKTHQYRFNSEIINVLQYQDFVIVFTKDEDELQVINLSISSVIELNPIVKKILYSKNQIQYQKIQQNSLFQAFFFTQSPQIIIQYLNFLIIPTNSNFEVFEIDSIQIVILRVLVPKTNYILGVHLIQDKLIEQIYQEDSITNLNQVDLNDFQIVRPLQYQINTEYFAIATRKAFQTFILVFAISQNSPIKQIQIIEYTRTHFFFQESQLFYYDQDDQIQRFNMREFEIQFEYSQFELREKTNPKKIFFEIVPIKQNLPSLNVELNIYLYDQCYQLFQKKNHTLQLKHNSEAIFKLNITDQFFGPIENISVINNSYIKIEGPTLLSDEIDINNLPQGATLKCFQIESTLSNAVNLNNITVLQIKNQSIILYKQLDNNRNEKVQNIILLNEDVLLFFFVDIPNNQQRVVKYQFDNSTLQLKQQYILEDILNIQFEKQYKIYRTGNLIKVLAQDLSQLILYQIVELDIVLINQKLNFYDILKIEGSDNLYVSLSEQGQRSIMQFEILTLNYSQFRTLKTVTLTWSTMQYQLKNFIQSDWILMFQYDYQVQILECQIQDEKVQIVIAQDFKQVMVISEIIIYMEDTFYQPKKILRIFKVQFDLIQLQYYSKSNVILQSKSYKYYYDLNEQSIIVDYIAKTPIFLQFDDNYHQLNTTHFIVYKKTNQKIFIGKIGYKIRIDDKNFQNGTFTIMAENQVSRVNLQISLVETNTQVPVQPYLFILLFIFILFLVFCFFVRRMQLKHKQQPNFKNNFNDKNDSESFN